MGVLAHDRWTSAITLQIVELYRRWVVTQAAPEALDRVLGSFPKRVETTLRAELPPARSVTIWEAYNRATGYATHQMRSYRSAFDLLGQINRQFQIEFADLQMPISLS